MSDEEIPLRHVEAWVCELCMTGAGGECHVPGCSFWFHDAPSGATLDWLREGVRELAETSVSDGPVHAGPHTIALGGIARDVGLTLDATGARIALTVADRVAELERLRAQREGALALHRDAGAGMGYTDTGYGDIEHACGSCGQHDEYAEPWPCPTARALGAES